MIRKLKTLLLKIDIFVSQRRFQKLKFLFKGGESKTLLVVFSGFSGDGTAKYNYVKTLKAINVNKLFILDDFGYKRRGSYYLGENGEWFVPPMVIELIKKIKKEEDLEKIITIGSSKGGTAALYYAIKIEADSCIIGAPQYFCGDYLNTTDHKALLEGIMGGSDEEDVQKLNSVLVEAICNAKERKPEINIHYSPNEHTYPEHIFSLISDLRGNGFEVFEDSSYEYTEHSEVSKYFPRYLLKIVQQKA